MSPNNGRSGFTMIEFTLVVAITGILILGLSAIIEIPRRMVEEQQSGDQSVAATDLTLSQLDKEVRFARDVTVPTPTRLDVTDHGDFTLAAKYRFLDGPEGSWLPSLGLLPFVKLPVSEEPLGSGKTDVGALLLVSLELPARLNLDFNGGLAAVGQSRPSGYLLEAILAAGLSRDLGERLTLFTDLFYATRDERQGRDGLLLDAGVIWRPTPDVALDASVVTSLAGRGPDWALRGGVSVRFGR